VNWGTKYSRDFTTRLKDSVSKHLTIPHKFYCYTDNPIEDYDVPVKYPYLSGVWHKLALLENTGDSLFFDQDIEINSNIDFLAKDFDKFTVIDSTPWKPKNQTWFQFRLTQNTLVNSSVMRWSNHKHIFDKFQLHRDMYLRLYAGIDRFIYNEDVQYDYFDTDEITSWYQKVDKTAIVLYNGKY
jgi:hypothetical protein